MKKLSLIVGLALVMLAASCSKDATSDINPSVKTILGVTIDNPQSRTYIGEANAGVYPILWSEGDKIVVNDEIIAVDPKFVGKSSIQVEVAAAPDYKLAYPAELVNGDVVTIPEVQKFVEGSFAVGSGLLAGYSVDENVMLGNLHGYLKFTITNAAEVKNVTVIANGGESISGTYTLNYQYPFITPLAGKDIIRVTDVVATNGVATVVIAVPAAEYSQGFTVKVYDNNNGVMTQSLKGSGAEVKAGVIYNMPQLAYAPTSTEALIMTASDLVDFVTLANAGTYDKWVNADGEVKFGADIDLAGVTLPQIKKFEGKLNAQGFALKNWTTSLAFIGELAAGGVLKNFVTDQSCSLVPDLTSSNTHIGIIVGYAYGLVEGCVNNANITINGNVVSSSLRFGTIVASGYGRIKNCINNGDFILNLPVVDQHIYVGGITGYYNPAADCGQGEVFMTNCINNGAVKVTVDDLPRRCYMGGLVGATAMSEQYETVDGAKKAKLVASEGTITNCYNNGEVYYSFKTPGSATYTNMGGIIGFSQATLIGCENTGEITLTIPNSDTASGSRPAVGGIVGASLFSVTNCINYGNIYVDGPWSSASSSNVGASGLGAQVQPCFGGVVGSIGHYNLTTSETLSNCENYGILTLKPTILPSAGTKNFFGGVVGYSTIAVANCSNHGHMEIESQGLYAYAGGVVGYTQDGHTVTECINIGDISLKHDISGSTLSSVYDGTEKVRTFFGGVIAYAQGVLNNCHNHGSATVYTNSRNLYSGGVVGYTNSTALVASSSNAGAVTCYINYTGNVMDCTGYEPYHYVGGVVGYGSANLGVITNEDTASLTVYTNAAGDFGGVVGYALAQNDQLVNNAPMTIDFSYLGQVCSQSVMVGGVIAKNYCDSTTKVNVSSCTNTGKLTVKNLAYTGGFSYFGGIIGSNASGVGAIRNCVNTGDIDVDVPSTIRLGGIAGYTVCDLTNSTFKGNITAKNLKYSSESRHASVGGLIGYTAQGIVGGEVDCVINAQGDTGIAVGGVMGTSAADTWTGLTIKADVSASADATLGLLLGGKVASSNITVTLGSTSSPIKISKQSKINGVAIRADGNDPLSGMPASAIIKVTKVEYID